MTKPSFLRSIDHSSLHVVGSKLFMISQLEDIPSAMVGVGTCPPRLPLHTAWGSAAPRSAPLPVLLQYVVELDQDAATGALTPTSIAPVDWSAYGGLLFACAGSTTPWGTHLGAEETDPDQRAFDSVCVHAPAALRWHRFSVPRVLCTWALPPPPHTHAHAP